MNFYEMWHYVEGIQNSVRRIHVRWAAPNEQPQISQFAASHPDFASSPDTFAMIRKLNRARDIICIVAIDENDQQPVPVNVPSLPDGQDDFNLDTAEDAEVAEKIIGFAMYGLHEKFIDVPVVVGDQEVCTHLLKMIMGKVNNHRRHSMVVRADYNVGLLNAMKTLGFGTQSEGDKIVGKYPKNNMATPGAFQSYDQRMNPDNHPQQPSTDPNADDPYGLFKNKPWKDPQRDDDEMV